MPTETPSRHPLLRPLLGIEFLLALQTCFVVWSHVGGEYHLTLVPWPWKLGVGVAAAVLAVALTVALMDGEGTVNRRVLVLGAMLVMVVLAAGALSYTAHLNEPADDDQEDEPDSTMFSRLAAWPARAPYGTSNTAKKTSTPMPKPMTSAVANRP